jgi:CDP-diacylglycerol--glycerol-3-phosphate 3-phosphatidyltransferase
MTVSNDSRARIKKAFEPIALGLGRLGLTPDALTLVGFAITVVGAVLVSQQLWLAGGIVVLAGGVFDMFDGTLARATNRVSNLGAFMDSVFDRAGEAIVYVAIVIGCSRAQVELGAWFGAAALAAAFMVSYVRAKSEGLGFTQGTGMAAIGVMPREVRLVVLTIGLVGAAVLGGVMPIEMFGENTGLGVSVDATGSFFLLLALGIITLGATITTIQRILHVRSQARHQSIGTQ